MFLPFTCKASEVPAFSEMLDRRDQKCMCGGDVRLRNCLVTWTAHGKEDYQYFAVCSPQCIIIHVREGSC